MSACRHNIMLEATFMKLTHFFKLLPANNSSPLENLNKKYS